MIEESVVPLALKNTRKGDIPEPRTALTFRARVPLVPVQEAVVGVGALAVTATVADWLALPPVPVQVKV